MTWDPGLLCGAYVHASIYSSWSDSTGDTALVVSLVSSDCAIIRHTCNTPCNTTHRYAVEVQASAGSAKKEKKELEKNEKRGMLQLRSLDQALQVDGHEKVILKSEKESDNQITLKLRFRSTEREKGRWSLLTAGDHTEKVSASSISRPTRTIHGTRETTNTAWQRVTWVCTLWLGIQQAST